MTPITSTRSELQAYLLELQLKIDEGRMQGLIARDLVSHWEDLAIETLDAINELDRRECPHEDFADTLSGRKCLSCGLETNNQPEPKGYPDDYSAAFRARFPK